jgi:hypothetical protein
LLELEFKTRQRSSPRFRPHRPTHKKKPRGGLHVPTWVGGCSDPPGPKTSWGRSLLRFAGGLGEEKRKGAARRGRRIAVDWEEKYGKRCSSLAAPSRSPGSRGPLAVALTGGWRRGGGVRWFDRAVETREWWGGERGCTSSLTASWNQLKSFFLSNYYYRRIGPSWLNH